MRQNLSLSTLMAKVFAGLVVALLIVGCGPQEIPDTNEESSIGAATEGWIRVVRGVNGGFCSGMAIGNGNDPKVKPTGDLTNLSVNCSKNKQCSAPGSLDTSLSHAAGLIEIAACHA